MANALKKINARAKRLSKMPKNKNKKYRTLQKQAASEYNKGRLGARKKPAKKKAVRRRPKKAVKRRAKRKSARRKQAKPKVIRRRTVVVYKTKRRSSRRSVSGFGKVQKLIPFALLAVGAYLVLKPKTPIPPLVQTTNPVRNQTASDILLYAQAASMSAAAIAKLIETINQSTDQQVNQIYSNVKSGTNPYDNTGFIAGRPVLVRAMQ